MKIKIEVSLVRFFIVLFWILVIGIFLIIPNLTNLYLKKGRSLTIFTWALLLDPIYLKKFEQETGIKLYISYFDSGPALLNKIAATKGYGYDILFPDDRSLQVLIQEGYLKKIDRNKILFWENLVPNLLGTYADPTNDYSIPYYWGIYGIGYNESFFANKAIIPSWEMLFNNKYCTHTKICMTDEPREAILMAAQYLFGSIEALKSLNARLQVKHLLIEQKKNVEVYTSLRADSLLQSKSCALAAIMSPDVWRLAKDHPQIKMLVPQEGSFKVIDSVALPKTTHKDDLIYTFLNFLFTHSVMQHHVELFGFCSPLKTITVQGQEQFCPVHDGSNIQFFKNIISDEDINQMWIEILAA